MQRKCIKVCSNENDLINELAGLLARCYHSNNDPIFTVGLSGGSLVALMSKVFPIMKGIDWKKWRFFFCDERLVSFDDSESTFGTYWKAIEPLSKSLPLREEQFVTINQQLDGEDVANDYIEKIKKHGIIDRANNLPKFHIILLGMGPDGHTASLFPGHKLLQVSSSMKQT